MSSSSGLASTLARSLASHLIDARGTVEPNVDPEGVESRLRDGVFLWLDIESPTEADFQLLHDVFDLHPLTLEDARKFGQRPKIEDFDDYTLLVVFGALDDDSRRSGLKPIEVHCFYSPHWLITVHKGECPVFGELRDRSHRRLQKYEEGLGILYLVVDELVDNFLPQLSELDDEIDELEDTILTDPQPAALQRAITMKRQLVQLRKIVHPQRDMLAGLLAGRYELPGMTEEYERYYRDVYDHLIRVAEQLDDYRDLASGVTDLYQSTVGNKMNLTMKQLGWVATFFLPLSFLTGFFGQNFNLLTANYIVPGWTFWVLGIGLDVAAFAAVLAWYVNRERGNLLLRVPELRPCRAENDRAVLGRRALVPGGDRQGPPLVRGGRPPGRDPRRAPASRREAGPSRSPAVDVRASLFANRPSARRLARGGLRSRPPSPGPALDCLDVRPAEVFGEIRTRRP